MEEKTIDLQYCPFCGEFDPYVDAFSTPRGYQAEVECRCCGARILSLTFRTKDKALVSAAAIWNRRA